MTLRFKLSLTLMAVMSFAASASAAPHYVITDIGDINGANYARAFSLNNNGDVVGIAKTSSANAYFAFLYTDGNMNSLGSFEGAPQSGTVSYAASINDSGQIAGYSRIYGPSGGPHAFRYDGWGVVEGNFVNGVMNDLETLTVVEGGVTKVSTSSYGLGINDVGHVVGWSTIGSSRGFLSTGPGSDMVEIGYLSETQKGSSGTAISNNGKITGYSYLSDDSKFYSRAYIKNPGEGLQELGTLGGESGTQGNAINDNGQVAGISTLSSEDGGYDRAFLYNNATEGMFELGVLGTGLNSEALGINEDGDVVGYSNTSGGRLDRAFIYTDGEMFGLGERINPSLGWTLRSATDINENGQICGYGANSLGSIRSFIMTPALDGDANLDGTVDLLDLTLLGGNWRGSDKDWWEGDFNDDGLVDLLDLTLLGTNWRQTADGLSFSEAMTMVNFAVVPEPGTFVLLLVAALGLAAEMFRRRWC